MISSPCAYFLENRKFSWIHFLIAGDVPRVDGQLAVARAFGDRSLKKHLSSEPHVAEEPIDENTDFLILASDGLWKVVLTNLQISVKDKRASFLTAWFISIPKLNKLDHTLALNCNTRDVISL
jgi:serine/threonine protein phosphatase PrpC